MKVKIGDRVEGEVASGTVIAMTSEWCIYRLDKAASDGLWECAEPWHSIQLAYKPPREGEEVTARTEHNL